MTFHIALAGKGSAGKSTLLPHLIHHLRHHHPTARLLVVDADPHMSSTTLLGVVPATTLGGLRTRYERVLTRGDGLRDSSREAFAEQAMGAQALLGTPDYDLLAMGHWALPGSQCVANRVLARALTSLSSRYDIVVSDHEAGIEQMGRFASFALDLLLLVATPDPLFIDVAGRVLARSREVERQIARHWLVLNRTQPGDLHEPWLHESLRELAAQRVQVVAALPESAGLRALSRARRSPLLLEASDPWHGAVADLGARVARLMATASGGHGCGAVADEALCL